MTCQDITKVTGQHLVFLGVNTASWSLAQFSQAGAFAKAHGVDSLLLKVADGTHVWYGGMDGYRQRRDAIKAQGVGVIPYTYSYGNKYGVIDSEIGILKGFMQEDGVVCMDAEAEWNGQVGWASHLCSSMTGTPGIFLVSTWADPAIQNWMGVLAAMNPCVDAYMPQQYSNFLAPLWTQFGATGAACIQPTVDISQEAGPNDPVAIARVASTQGHTALSVWHHDLAVANPALLDAIFAAFPKKEEDSPMVIDLTTPLVGNYFESTGNDAVWQCKQTGFLVGHGILSFYQKFGGDALCGLTYLGLAMSNEIAITGHPGSVYQKFERGTVVYNPDHSFDFPPGSGPVYTAHTNATF